MNTCEECGKLTVSDWACIHCQTRCKCLSRQRVGDYVYHCSQDSYHGDNCTFFDGQAIDYAPVFVSQPRH